MNPIFAICIAGLSFSFFPLMNAYGTMFVGPVTFSVINHISTIVMSGVVLLILFEGPKKALKVLLAFKDLPLNVKLIGIFSGLAIYLGGLFFIFSLQLMSKAGATVITEMWPALAIFTAPLLISKRWQKIRLFDFWMLITCLVGVVFITASESGQNFSSFVKSPFFFHGDYGFEECIGILLAVLSAYCFAFSGVSRAHFANSLPQDFRDEYMGGGVTIKEAIYTYIVTYLAGVPLVFMLLLVMEPNAVFAKEAFIPGIMNGLFLTITSALYSYAILKSDNPNINVLWYFAPLLASLWLILFDFSIATDMIVIGGALIILANLAIIMVSDKKKQAVIPLEPDEIYSVDEDEEEDKN